MTKRPPLPPATVIDGRSLYTAGDMRAYYDLAPQLNDYSDDENNDLEVTDPETKQESSASVDNLMKMFGMKK